jgi:hypothetical protein
LLAEAALSSRDVIDVYDPTEGQPQTLDVEALPRGSRLDQAFAVSQVAAELAASAWYAPVRTRLIELMRLQRNWDTYGGVAVQRRSATHALWFLARLLERDTSAPWVVPLSEGGVQLEWHTPDLDLEAVFTDEGDEVSISDRARGVDWEGSVEASFDVLRPVVGDLRTP